MSTPKKRKAITPASKPNSRKPVSAINLSKKSAVSTEYVQDSDRDSDSNSDSNSGDEEDSDGSTEDTDSEEGQKPEITETLRPESAAESPNSKKPTKKEKQPLALPLINGTSRVNGISLAHVISSGSDDSGSGSSESGGQSSSEEEGESSKEKDKSNGVEGKSSGAEDESSEEDGTEEESDSNQSKESGSDISQPAQRAQSHTQSNIQSRPYKAPLGFEKVKISSGSLVSRKLSNKELSGKRLWHITAPADIPINKIKEASMQSIANQETVLSYESKDYELVKYDEVQHPSLLLPSDIEGGYRIEPIKFMHSLHLQQKLKAPCTESTIPLSAQQLLQKPIRPQPKGLKMRYKPFGLEFGGPEELDTDSSGETSLQKSRIEISTQNLPTSPVHGGSEEVNHRKDILTVPDGQSTVKTLSKKRKRDQENKETRVEVVESDPIRVDASHFAAKRKKKRKSAGFSQSQSSQDVVSGGSPSIVSSQPSQDSKKSKKHKSKEKEKGRPD